MRVEIERQGGVEQVADGSGGAPAVAQAVATRGTAAPARKLRRLNPRSPGRASAPARTCDHHAKHLALHMRPARQF
jgi:hypothetical protein